MTGTSKQEILLSALTKLQNEFEAGMKWLPETTDYQKTIVKCNLNGFCGFLSKRMPEEAKPYGTAGCVSIDVYGMLEKVGIEPEYYQDAVAAIEEWVDEHIKPNFQAILDEKKVVYTIPSEKYSSPATIGKYQLGTKQSISNTEILMFILGWQGGTVHQVAEALGISTGTILNADYDKMQDLMRLAQKKRTRDIAHE